MSNSVEYLVNTASTTAIAKHLALCDRDFIPPLSARVELDNYADKIARRATTFEAWSERRLVGLVAGYCNDKKRGVAHISNVSVLNAWSGKGIAARLVRLFAAHSKELGLRRITLAASSGNHPAIKLYEKCGFVESSRNSQSIEMNLNLENG